MKRLPIILAIFFSQIPQFSAAQFLPTNLSSKENRAAKKWVNKTYRSLSQDEKLGQLFIVALYTNKGEEHIQSVRQIVENEQIGGLILMQDDAGRHINLVNEFQRKSKVKMLIGMDAEWGLFQRIPAAHKLPWAITLGAVQDKSLIYEMSSKIAEDAKKIGVNWDFAPVVDVNTNPQNPIIGNRSFGSEVGNVTASALAYAKGLQDNGVLAAIKHFPGHGDTDTDSHLELPVVSHDIQRLENVEMAPFRNLMNEKIGGVMVAHLYVPALENRQGVPASVSEIIVTGILKNQLKYNGLIITDALNMNAVADRYKAGELDALAFKAGNDLMLFSQDVKKGKQLIQNELYKNEIPKRRLKESVKKILLTKYYLGLNDFQPRNSRNISEEINNKSHRELAQKIYANALTLIKNEGQLLPLKTSETYYFVPLEEADYNTFYSELEKRCAKIILKKPSEIGSIPRNSKVLVSFHKDNSTAYKPYKISDESQTILKEIAQNHQVLLNVFGSPYALRDMDISRIPAVAVAYENNDDSMIAAAKAFLGKTKIHGRLPVLVNDSLKAGTGMDLEEESPKNTK
ncbi:glycoside hydrolase family 3 protein [Cruoricaptor ignavus]|uniref:beta-N-acetylhexosaminidase n=1 Tax=Cruoricaptor ignavus TaxID=1118202 RepID=A0A7M1T6C3_9FLAO|nr:glycoside hydrolase family 3 protein [Cruoricaptor ignavus]QOR74513.1 glycoside hydrolase family 3 protein [Cruoricaptor ignavus]